jgi:general nucleoside transport system permease protein
VSEILNAIFSVAFVVTVIRTTTPLLLATLGGLIADLSGVLNVALDGIMLVGALTAVLVSVYAQWYIGVLAALSIGMALAALIAFFHLRLKADIVLVGFAINIFASGATVSALAIATGGDKGTSTNLMSKAIPAIDLGFLSAIPVVGPTLSALLSGSSILSWLAASLVFGIWHFLYRTPQGLWLRAVGEYPAAPQSAGVPVLAVRTWALVASGALAGLAGAQLAMFNYVGFTRDMTAGRGFIALGAVLLGARHPIGGMFAALLFGMFEALSILLPGIFSWVPSELINSIPFVVTIVALLIFGILQRRGRSPA